MSRISIFFNLTLLDFLADFTITLPLDFPKSFHTFSMLQNFQRPTGFNIYPLTISHRYPQQGGYVFLFVLEETNVSSNGIDTPLFKSETAFSRTLCDPLKNVDFFMLESP